MKVSVSCFLPSANISFLFITVTTMTSPSSKHTSHFCQSLSFWFCCFLFYFEVLSSSVCFPAPTLVCSVLLFRSRVSASCVSALCFLILRIISGLFFAFVSTFVSSVCLTVDCFNSNHLESEPNHSFVTLLNKRLVQPFFVTVFNTFLSSSTTIKTSPDRALVSDVQISWWLIQQVWQIF